MSDNSDATLLALSNWWETNNVCCQECGVKIPIWYFSTTHCTFACGQKATLREMCATIEKERMDAKLRTHSSIQ